MHLLCNVYIDMNIATLQNMDYFFQVKHSKSFLLKAWSVQFLTIHTTLLNSGESEPQPNIASQSKQGNSPSLIGRDRHVLHFIPVRWTQHTKFFFLGGGLGFLFFVSFFDIHDITFQSLLHGISGSLPLTMPSLQVQLYQRNALLKKYMTSVL